MEVVHYGQSVVEGTKAYRADEQTINFFRLDQNYERLAKSCKRMCIPPVERHDFMESIRKLVEIDSEWVPRREGHVLYIRPFACAFDPVIAASPGESYRFYVITSPVGS